MCRIVRGARPPSRPSHRSAVSAPVRRGEVLRAQLGQPHCAQSGDDVVVHKLAISLMGARRDLSFDVVEPPFKELGHRSLVGGDIAAVLHLDKDSGTFSLRFPLALAAGQGVPLHLALAGLRIAD